MSSARTTEPFFTVSKSLMRLIRERVEGTDCAFCLCVFVALREHANDERANNQVEATVSQIAAKAGVGYNTAAKALGILEAIGAIQVQRRHVPGTKARAPSMYIFPIRQGTSPTIEATLPVMGRTFDTMGDTFPAEDVHRGAEIEKELEDRKELLPAPRSAGGVRVVDFPKRNSLARADDSFDALARAEGSAPDQLTRPAARTIAVALAEIRRATPSVTASEIEQRALNYRRVMPTGATLTASALAKHWARCGGSSLREGAGSPIACGQLPPDDWKAVWRERFPPEDYPDAPRYEEGEWRDVPGDHKQLIRDEAKRRLRRSA